VRAEALDPSLAQRQLGVRREQPKRACRAADAGVWPEIAGGAAFYFG
jgi:hypothetical protein